jgi:hypothetical protein
VAVGVGRTAGAVGGLADSGLMVRLTRGRLWIGLLATLLVGIVALNVVALGINAASSKVSQASDQLRRANSALRAGIAGDLSNEKVQAAAAALGLAIPAPGDVRYLRPGANDATEAARRLLQGELTQGTAYPPSTTTTATTTAAATPTATTTTPTVTTPVPDPTATTTATETTTASATTTAPPATPTTTAPSAPTSGGSSGGGFSP